MQLLRQLQQDLRMSEISSKVGEDTNVCSNYIKNLINFGMLDIAMDGTNNAGMKWTI